MIKTIYFDLGNVLIFVHVDKMLEQLAKLTRHDPEALHKLICNSNLQKLYEAGIINTQQFYEQFLKLSSNEFSLEEFKEAFSNIFTPNLDLWPVIEKLKRENIRLILLSNTSECHFQYSEKNYPIIKLFDHKILSFEVGASKPDQRIFQKALESCSCKPEECFYTDDIPTFIESARHAGLKGETFVDVPTLKMHLKNRGLDFI